MTRLTHDLATSICLACNWSAWQTAIVIFILYLWAEIISAKVDLMLYGKYVFNAVDVTIPMAFFTLTILCILICRAHWREAQ